MTDKNAAVIIKTDTHKMKAIAHYMPQQGKGEMIYPEDILSQLSSMGIVFGINNETISYICSATRPLRSIVIAEGKMPQVGEKASIQPFFTFQPRHKALEREDGTIDFRDLGDICSAAKGQELYRKIPPTIGEPGENVFGEEIVGLPGRDLNIILGTGTAYDPEDQNLVRATSDGEIIVKKGVVHVTQNHVVKGDVDYSTGNLQFNGSIMIHGSVKAGFNVEAEGTIEIKDTVEDAVVKSGNDIIIKGGYSGNGNGRVISGRDVLVKFVENQSIHAERDIILFGPSYHSHLTAGRSIITKGEHSVIVGGVAEAKISIEAKKLGSDVGTATVLRVGVDPKLAENIQTIEEEIVHLRDSQEKIEKSIIYLYKVKIDGHGKLPPDKKVLLDKLEETKKSMPETLSSLQSKLENLKREQKEVGNAFVTADIVVYPKVQVYIGTQWITVEDMPGPSVFKMVKGDVVRLSK